jgi:hypothetical protein
MPGAKMSSPGDEYRTSHMGNPIKAGAKHFRRQRLGMGCLEGWEERLGMWSDADGKWEG